MQIELRGRRRPNDKVTWEIWKEAGEGRIRGWPLSDSDLVTRCPPAGHKTFREFWTHQTSFWGSSASLHGEFTQVYSVRVDGWVEWHRGSMISSDRM